MFVLYALEILLFSYAAQSILIATRITCWASFTGWGKQDAVGNFNLKDD